MSRALNTGMSGTGKSSLLAELARRGHPVLDTDDAGWHRADGTWDEPRLRQHLEAHPDLVVAGTAENQGRFSPWFDQVVLLSAPVEVLIDRLRGRTNNPYGKTDAEQRDVRRYVLEVEPLLRATASVEIDARRPLPEIADRVESLLRG